LGKDTDLAKASEINQTTATPLPSKVYRQRFFTPSFGWKPKTCEC
jgi:hypothetical protein